MLRAIPEKKKKTEMGETAIHKSICRWWGIISPKFHGGRGEENLDYMGDCIGSD